MAELNTLSLPNVPSLPSSLSLAVSFVALKTGLLVDTTLSDDRCSKYAAKKHTAINKRKATPDTTPMIIYIFTLDLFDTATAIGAAVGGF